MEWGYTENKVISYASFNFFPLKNKECRLEIDLKETGCEGLDWIYLAQEREQ
jgi:hypothetical protein